MTVTVTHKDASLFQEITYMDVINKKTWGNGSTAVTLCMENSLPIIVFNLQEKITWKKQSRETC